MTDLKSIVERLKKGEHVKGDDKAIFNLPARQTRRVTNILRHFQKRRLTALEHMARAVGGESKLRSLMLEVKAGKRHPNVANYLLQEKRDRLRVIDKLEELTDNDT
jgi:hypothetical protein